VNFDVIFHPVASLVAHPNCDNRAIEQGERDYRVVHFVMYGAAPASSPVAMSLSTA
jgi:hypothetical protein